jgi:transposase-like protein
MHSSHRIDVGDCGNISEIPLKTITSPPLFVIANEHTYRETVFVSDRDKGLANAVEKWFPQHLSTHCAKHIERNVAQRFGNTAAKEVLKIAKCFSQLQETYHLENLKKISRGAYEYLMGIPREKWRTTTWVAEERLPRRYGIVTSNTSECTNSMLLECRLLCWMEAIERILLIITTRIDDNRKNTSCIGPQM